jgi:hypothetical protein
MDAEGEGPQALRSKLRTVRTMDILKKRGVFMIRYLQKESEFLLVRRIAEDLVPHP